MSAPTATRAVELVPLPERGRRVTAERAVRLGDVTPTGRLRLDALARYLQDIAGDDLADASIEGLWIMRRLAVIVERMPYFGDTVSLVTFCGGAGRRWAERRTTVLAHGEPVVETVAIWVYVHPETGRPAPLESWFWDLYGEAAGDRRVSSRLHLPGPAADAASSSWPVRASDLDVLGHANNAAHWEALEEVIAGCQQPRSRVCFAELEHRGAIDPGDPVELRRLVTGGEGAETCARAWLTCGDDVRTAARAYLS